jgi:hypothetical protein
MLAWRFVARIEKPEKPMRPPSLSRPVDTAAISKAEPCSASFVPG